MLFKEPLRLIAMFASSAPRSLTCRCHLSTVLLHVTPTQPPHALGDDCVLALTRMQTSALHDAARTAGRGLFRLLVRECRRFPDVKTR